MRIPESLFRRYFKVLPVKETVALKLTHEKYCDLLSARERCPGDCSHCVETLRVLLNIGQARNNYAVLNWRLEKFGRGELSVWANTDPKLSPGRSDAFGLPIAGNPLRELDRLIHETTSN